jgi:homocysteine S-methyltransferase
MVIMTSLILKLQHSLIIGDGAMATELYKLGVPIGVSCQELCLSQPALVRSVHEAYLEAGAGLLETNTFGANREGLSRYGLENKVAAINRAAVRLAREAAGDKAFVLGAMSSYTAGRIPTQAPETYSDQFEEQAVALLHEKPDGIMLETFLDAEELLLAVQVLRTLTDQPLFAQLALLEAGRTRDGYTVDNAFAQLRKAGADVVGLNCLLGPAELLRTLENAQIAPDALLSVFPNAGRLGYDEGEYQYKSTPEYFAESALRFRAQGVRVIGGCCGTTPGHIKAMARALEGLEPLPRINPASPAGEAEKQAERIEVSPRKKATIIDLVKQDHTVIVELDPPKDLETEGFLRGCQELHKAGAAAVTLAENSLANVRMSNLALGAILKGRYNIEPLLHITCRDRNLIGQQSYLMGLDALGINHVLVITGDPSHVGDLPGASSVFDVNSFELIRLTKQLNEGISFSGRRLKQQANFVVGAAFNPYVRNWEAGLRRLEKKIEAGADFIMTQPVYDTRTVSKIYQVSKTLPIPVFLGIMPLTGQRNAEFLHNEVPGISLAPEVLERMQGLQGAAGREEGLALCRELIDAAMPCFKGLYLITPFNYYEMTAQLTAYIQQKSRQEKSL